MRSEGTWCPCRELTQDSAGVTAWRAAGLCWSRELYQLQPAEMHECIILHLIRSRCRADTTASILGVEFGEEHKKNKAAQAKFEVLLRRARCLQIYQYSSFKVQSEEANHSPQAMDEEYCCASMG